MGNARSFLVPFKYSHKVAYVVEFSHLKIRLFAKNQIVTEGGIDFSNQYEILNKDENLEWQVADYPVFVIDSPYGYEDLWDEEDKCFGLQTIQHSDVLYIFNENHPITKKLQELYKSDKDEFNNYTKILYSEAKIIAGLPLDNPTEISNLICDVISKK